MTRTVERMARAIATKDGYAYYPDDSYYNGLALVALAAMREPSEEMVRAGELVDGTITAHDVWQAMIDKAIQEAGRWMNP